MNVPRIALAIFTLSHESDFKKPPPPHSRIVQTDKSASMYLPILFKVIMAPQVIKVKSLRCTPFANYFYKHI